MVSEWPYEIKFKLYDGNEQSLTDFALYFAQEKEKYLQEGIDGSVNSKVISYFFEGLQMLAKGDLHFWEENYLDANIAYEEAKRFLTRFQNSRGIDVALDKLNRRSINRVEGLSAVSKAMMANKPEMRLPLFNQALEQFNLEAGAASEAQETIHAMVAYSRALFVEALWWRDRAVQQINEDQSFEAKKCLMKSRSLIKQTAFINFRNRGFVDQIENQLDDLTKERLLVKAAKLGEEGTNESEEGNFDKAKDFFSQATLFYNRASALSADSMTRRLLLSTGTVLEASVIECDGNKFYRHDNNMEEATKKFSEAASRVDKAIALIGSFGGASLRATFTAQRDYYLGMSKLTEGILLFDEENYESAQNIYKTAQEVLERASVAAKASDNESLNNLSSQAIADLDGYIKMCETFM